MLNAPEVDRSLLSTDHFLDLYFSHSTLRFMTTNNPGLTMNDTSDRSRTKNQHKPASNFFLTEFYYFSGGLLDSSE